MVRKSILAIAVPFAIMLASCIGSDPAADTTAENTRALCTNGEDDDGDGHFDCYDPNCRSLDSISRIAGDTVCPYEDYRPPVIIPTSSSNVASSSATSSSQASSSSSSEVAAGAFPYELAQDNDDVKALKLLAIPGTVKVAVAGKIGNQAMYLILDTAGTVVDKYSVQTPDDLLTGADQAVYGSPTRREFVGVNVLLDQEVTFFGTSYFETGRRATSYYLVSSGNGLTSNNYIWPTGEFMHIAPVTTTALCYVFNSYGGDQPDTGFVAVDANLDDGFVPTKIGKLIGGTMVAGEVANEKCLSVGVRTTVDSTQIWFYRVSKLNERDNMVQVTTGSANEVAYELETVGTKTYIAAKVDGTPRMLVLNSSYAVEVDGASQALGVGTPYGLRAIDISGTERLLMVGEAGGKGMLWVMGVDGSRVNSAVISEMDVITDAVQLPGGNILLSGWKATAGGGTTAVILKINAGLSVLK
jgi:hypothetical protein